MSVTTIGSWKPRFRPYRLRTINGQVQTEARTGRRGHRLINDLERFSCEAEEARGGGEKRVNVSGRLNMTSGCSDATWRPSSFPYNPQPRLMRSDATRISSLIGLRAVERSHCRVTRGGTERTDVNRSAHRVGSRAPTAALSCSLEPISSNCAKRSRSFPLLWITSAGASGEHFDGYMTIDNSYRCFCCVRVRLPIDSSSPPRAVSGTWQEKIEGRGRFVSASGLKISMSSLIVGLLFCLRRRERMLGTAPHVVACLGNYARPFNPVGDQ